MRLKFFGADREVTGSCHCIEINGKKLLIDCGMLQGQDAEKEEQAAFAFDAASIDYVLVTHAHIDHTGRLPLLVKQGFRGKIYATRKTCELMKIMLEDSARIQEMDAEWKKRKRRRLFPERRQTEVFNLFLLRPKLFGNPDQQILPQQEMTLAVLPTIAQNRLYRKKQNDKIAVCHQCDRTQPASRHENISK